MGALETLQADALQEVHVLQSHYVPEGFDNRRWYGPLWFSGL